MSRTLAALFAFAALVFTQGCVAVQAVGVAAGVAGATIGVAGDVAEGTAKVLIPGDGDDDEDDGED
ncbi:MAG: hypothetical protein ABL308_08895 [Oceanicaulis sp.]